MKAFLLTLISFTAFLGAEHKGQMLYLMRSNELSKSLALYEKHYKESSQHDFEILAQLSHIILDQSSRSDDPEKGLLGLLGLGYAGISSSVDIMHILERGIKTHSIQTQLYAIQFLGRLQDDRSEELLTKAISSEFLLIRLEAAYLLSIRKERSAIGQIEALMNKLPKAFRFYFPEFFLQIGSPEAISIVRHLLNDLNPQVRIATLLHAAMHNRDDLLPAIRSQAQQGSDAEREAALSALGFLKDSHSLPILKKQANSPSIPMSLAALRSIYLLGETGVREQIIEKAHQKNIFAIALLADISQTEPVLIELISDKNIQVRFNAALSLLRHKNPACLDILYEILIRDTRDLGFQPYFTAGASLSAIKVIPSAEQHHREEYYDLRAISLSVREQVLKESLELPEKKFLKLARRILHSNQLELVPLLISLLENLQTTQALNLLKEASQKAGSPLVRNYCNLALFRLRQEGPYEQRVYDWLYSKKKDEMIRFRPLSARMPHRKETPFELTPEENSRLLIESYAALADRHNNQSIDALLFALKEGKEKNRPLLAGLLLRAIQ